VHLMPDQENIENKGGTMRLGAYSCQIATGSKSHQVYQCEQVEERHRHRYEINNDYREQLQQAGLIISGISPDGRLVEMVELTDHPWFVACQFHPELKSRPNRPHPLFLGLVKSALEYQQGKGLF